MDGENEAVYRRWANCDWWEDDFDMLWSGSELVPKRQKSDETDVEEGGKGGVRVLGDIMGKREKCRREEVVYLTADSEEEILELKEGETYVIGGIVDRNRYKVGLVLQSDPTRQKLTFKGRIYAPIRPRTLISGGRGYLLGGTWRICPPVKS